jgi:hypothetical protein
MTHIRADLKASTPIRMPWSVQQSLRHCLSLPTVYDTSVSPQNQVPDLFDGRSPQSRVLRRWMSPTPLYSEHEVESCDDHVQTLKASVTSLAGRHPHTDNDRHHMLALQACRMSALTDLLVAKKRFDGPWSPISTEPILCDGTTTWPFDMAMSLSRGKNHKGSPRVNLLG